MKKPVFAMGLLLPTIALAQPYAIEWYKVAGGGGKSTGGAYSVGGTIGQPDSGTMTGANYTLAGGFWSVIAALQSPGAPLLTISFNPQLSTTTVSWPSPSAGFVLEQNSGLNTTNWANFSGPINDNGTTRSVTVPSGLGNVFFRLKK